MIKVRFSGFLTILYLALLWFFCGLAQADILYVVNSQSRTLSRIDTDANTVNNSFAQLGTVPNKIVVDGNYIWAVNSGDNAVQKLSRLTGATLANIFIGMGSNPWDALKHGDFLYVTGLFTGKVYKVDTLSGSVAASVNVGTAPEGLCVIGNRLYVANAGNYMQNYAGSSVSVIDLDSFSAIATIPVSANPQYLAAQNGLLHVSCTGNWTDLTGVIYIIDPATNSVIHTLPLGGTPGCLWMDGSELALVGDSNGSVLYSYNPLSFSLINGSTNPIQNGGSEVVGNAAFIAVLSPNWGNNGTVKLLHQDLSPWKQYTVAMMPTDLKLWTQPSEDSDQVGAVSTVCIYPNPSRQGEKLKLSSSQEFQGEFSLYNQKGQRVLSKNLHGQELNLGELKLGSGIYFYRVYSNGLPKPGYTGKLVILK